MKLFDKKKEIKNDTKNKIDIITKSDKYESQIGQDESGQRYIRYYNTFKEDFDEWKITNNILVGNEEYHKYAIQFFGSDFEPFIPNFSFSNEYSYKTDLDLTFVTWYPIMFNAWVNNFKKEFIDDIMKSLKEYEERQK